MRLLVVLLLANFAMFGQNIVDADVVERNRAEGIRIAFYNVENLFDTIDDARKNDREFLPNSEKEYNTRKYRTKVANTAKVIRAIGGWQAPEIVGMAEIENRGVMLDVAAHFTLQKANYEVVHFDSPDPRGIDVGLLYNREILDVLHSAPLVVKLNNQRTRDILYVKLLFKKADTLHVFVNHWSSRRGGKDASAYKRMAASQVLRAHSDSIQKVDAAANIVVMGDFNDGPDDNSLKNLTGNATEFALNNLMDPLPKITGSHKYRGVWEYLDQLLVSNAMADSVKFPSVYQNRAFVFRADFLVIQDEKYGDVYPDRSWKGSFFTAGYSDHLPIFCDIVFQ